MIKLFKVRLIQDSVLHRVRFRLPLSSCLPDVINRQEINHIDCLRMRNTLSEILEEVKLRRVCIVCVISWQEVKLNTPGPLPVIIYNYWISPFFCGILWLLSPFFSVTIYDYWLSPFFLWQSALASIGQSQYYVLVDS
jgi:hypothetical protein